MEDRDLRFNSFGVLVFDELRTPFADLEYALHKGMYAEAQRIGTSIQGILVRRAYDLAYHVLLNTNPIDLAMLPKDEILKNWERDI